MLHSVHDQPDAASVHAQFDRRTDSVGIFPDRNAIARLVGAVLAEQTDTRGHVQACMSC